MRENSSVTTSHNLDTALLAMRNMYLKSSSGPAVEVSLAWERWKLR